jgi:hypothetical protein
VSTTVHSASEVITAVERAINDPRHLSPARRAIAAELFHNAGFATDRAVVELYALMDFELPARVEPLAHHGAAVGCAERALSR